MRPTFSLAHLTVLGTTPLELIEIAADAGYDYASIRTTPVAPGEQITPIAGDTAMVRRVARRLADTGLQVLDVELARLRPEDEPDQYLAVFDAAAAVGARHVIGQLPDPDRARATDRFGRLCDLALDFGLTVDLEFPSWSETGDLVTASAIVEAVDRTNAGVLIDALHFFRSDSSPDDIAALPRTWLRFVQLCDAPAHGRGDHPRGAGRPVAPRLRRPTPGQAAQAPPRRAVLAGGPQRRPAARDGDGGLRPPGAGGRPRGRRGPRPACRGPLTDRLSDR
jgi:sugar phosphate isomerase/epimerase